MDDTTQDLRDFIGRELGTVTLLRPLGKGAASIVFLGFQRTLKRQVAVKVLLKHPSHAEYRHRSFQREAEMVAGLCHPNIVPIFEMGEAVDCYYQVIQIIKGHDLEKILLQKLKHPVPSRRVLPLPTIFTIAGQVLDGLGHAHEQDIVHQDIKPANILIEEKTNRALISDFGISRTIQDDVREDGTISGSPLYMAPEYVSHRQIDSRGDIYAVGVVVFQMIVGNLPLTDTIPMAILARKIEAPDTVFKLMPSQTSPSIDGDLEKILLKAMAPDPEQRYQDCESLKWDIEEYRKRIPAIAVSAPEEILPGE